MATEYQRLLDEIEQDEEDEIIGYYCLGCGNIQDVDFECERCTGQSLDPIYF